MDGALGALIIMALLFYAHNIPYFSCFVNIIKSAYPTATTISSNTKNPSKASSGSADISNNSKVSHQ